MRTADADETHSHHVLLTNVSVAPSNVPSETVDFRRGMVGQTTWAGARLGWARLGQAGLGGKYSKGRLLISNQFHGFMLVSDHCEGGNLATRVIKRPRCHYTASS